MTLAADAGANLALLHPTFVRRLEALFAHPDAIGLRIVSAVRTEQRQRELWECYLAHTPGCNVAANPDRPIGDVRLFGEVIHAEGSWHMQQDGPGAHDYGYAVDVNWSRLGARARALIDATVPRRSARLAGAPAPWGLERTVEAPKWEPWHIQPIGDVQTPYDQPEDLTMADVAAILAKLDAIGGSVTKLGKAVALLRGDATVDGSVQQVVGAAVATLDDRLEAVENAQTELLTGCAAIVRRGDDRYVLLGTRRTKITHLDRDAQVEVKTHLGIERNSEQCSDEAWAVLVKLTDEV